MSGIMTKNVEYFPSNRANTIDISTIFVAASAPLSNLFDTENQEFPQKFVK